MRDLFGRRIHMLGVGHVEAEPETETVAWPVGGDRDERILGVETKQCWNGAEKV